MAKRLKIGDGLYDSTTSSTPTKLRLPPCPRDIYNRMGRPEDIEKIKLRLLKEVELTRDIEAFGMNTVLEFRIPTYVSQEEAIWYLDQLVRVARIVCMDEIELYFVEDGDEGPFNPINELESYNAILKGLREVLSHDIIYTKTPDIHEDLVSGESDGKAAFPLLENLVIEEINKLADKHANTYSDCGQYLGGNSSFDELVTMANSMGIKTKLTVADVSGGGRGLVAREDINIGDIVLEIPRSLVISAEGLDHKMVEKYSINGYPTSRDILALKIMKEGCCYDLFPKEIKTGLSFLKEGLAAAAGTLLHAEANSIRDWVRRVFKGLCRVDSDLSEEKYKFYVQAYELLISCSIETLSQDGMPMSFLAPFAGFFKRSLFPHVLRCDHEKESFRFIAARPCGKGQQCYLSYGYRTGFEIARNYGCLPKGKNHNDCIQFDHDYIDGDPDIMDDDSPWSYWMVRGDMKDEGKICLPKVFLDHLKLLVVRRKKNKIIVGLNDNYIENPAKILDSDASVGPISKIEKKAIHILLQCLEEHLSMIDFYETRENYKEALEKATWDVKLALDYRKIERDVCMSAISACYSSLDTSSTRIFRHCDFHLPDHSRSVVNNANASECSCIVSSVGV